MYNFDPCNVFLAIATCARLVLCSRVSCDFKQSECICDYFRRSFSINVKAALHVAQVRRPTLCWMISERVVLVLMVLCAFAVDRGSRNEGQGKWRIHCEHLESSLTVCTERSCRLLWVQIKRLNISIHAAGIIVLWAWRGWFCLHAHIAYNPKHCNPIHIFIYMCDRLLLSSAHQGCIYLIKNTVKLWNIIRI